MQALKFTASKKHAPDDLHTTSVITFTKVLMGGGYESAVIDASAVVDPCALIEAITTVVAQHGIKIDLSCIPNSNAVKACCLAMGVKLLG